jgi:ABC-type glycerol-3-phosphate transport system substrate-binding protein
MKIRTTIAALIIAAFCAAGCSKGDHSTAGNAAPNATASSAGAPSDSAPSAPSPAATAGTSDQEAIKAAIGRHLQENSGINMSAMDTSYDSISVQGDKAQANVTFRMKQGGPSMAMTYYLERHGMDWAVLRGESGAGGFKHPPMDNGHPGAPSDGSGPTTPDLKRFYKHDSSSSSSSSSSTAAPAAGASP